MPATYGPLEVLMNNTEKVSKDGTPLSSSGSPSHKVGANTEEAQALADARWDTLNERTTKEDGS